MLVSILGNTFDEVMESRERVTLQDLAEITLTAEAWWRGLAQLCCCRAPCVKSVAHDEEREELACTVCSARCCSRRRGARCRELCPLLPFQQPSFDDYVHDRWYPDWLHVLRPRGDHTEKGDANHLYTEIENLKQLLLEKNAHIEAAIAKQSSVLAEIQAMQAQAAGAKLV